MTTPGIFLRGMLMGAADIVPGVSGGTMAFITGIYGTLLASIRAVDLHCLKLLLAGDLKSAWQHVNGGFLLALLLGIATSILTLARLIAWLLEHYPVPLWAFFFGLILASALMLLRHVRHWQLWTVLALVAGIATALGIAVSAQMSLDAGMAGVFVAGFIAICAMILPGISGSFILVLLGMYGPVLVALRDFDLLFILVFALGAAAGLACFSRLLHFLLRRFHQATMALLTGFLLGSLAIVWPWKRVLEWVVDRHGELRAVRQLPVSPGEYLLLRGEDPMLLLCLLLMVAGFGLVWLVEARWGGAALEL